METVNLFDARIAELELENEQLREENASLSKRLAGRGIGPRSRRGDKETAKVAGDLHPQRRTSQRAKIAVEFAHAGIAGLTSFEAANRAGIRQESSPWKRVGELADTGWLVETSESRPSPATGGFQTVYRMPVAKIARIIEWGWLDG